MKGIEYYNKLIDGLIAKGIEPLVTIYHWDTPQYIQDLGGWTSPLIIDYFTDYVDVLFQHFGDRVKRWITVNEPTSYCSEGYGYTTKAPGVASPGVGDYLCVHHTLLANAAAYHLYKEKYFAKQGGQVGICLNVHYSYPAPSVDPSYTDKALEFELGKYTNPIFSKEGGYPQIMIDQIGKKSQKEGRLRSRLPTMSEEEKAYIRGTADFLALNYYTSQLVTPRDEWSDYEDFPIAWWSDMNLETSSDPSWKRAKTFWLYKVPEGLHDLLVWIKNKYDNPTVLITENGWSDEGQLDDDGRVEYVKEHLEAVSRAIKVDGCNVVAYTVWGLTDNFEWTLGYTERYGIHYINFISEEKERVPKKSALFFKEMMPTKSFNL